LFSGIYFTHSPVAQRQVIKKLAASKGGLGFLTRTHPDLKVLIDGPDLRQAFIAEMKKRYNSAAPAPVPATSSAPSCYHNT